MYGIGYAAVVEPSVSNMGYITAVLTPAERRRPGRRTARSPPRRSRSIRSARVSVHVASVPQGQGHRTVLAQVVADVFGLKPQTSASITEMDTAKDAWSIASGNYSSRFAPAVAGTAQLAADALARAAGAHRRQPAQHEADGDRVRRRPRRRARNPDNAISFARAGRGRPLGAGDDARRRRSDDPGDGVLDAAGTHRAERSRRGQ